MYIQDFLVLENTMKTVRISWKKVLPLTVLIFFMIYLLLPWIVSFFSFKIAKVERSNSLERPVFREDKTPGNFEVIVENRKGPGENGKAHRVTEQQKAEEERLKCKNWSIFSAEPLTLSVQGNLTLLAPCIFWSCIKSKINSNFYFNTSLWCLKRFYEGI